MSKAFWKKRVTSRNDLVGGQLYVRAYISGTGHPQWHVYKICGKASKHPANTSMVFNMPFWKLTVESQAKKARASQHLNYGPEYYYCSDFGLENRHAESTSVFKFSCRLVAELERLKSDAKKDIYKLPEGTWIELRWRDSPNDVLLLERRVEPMAGDCYVDTLCVVDGRLVKHRGAMHDQIVATHGRINVIAPTPKPKLTATAGTIGTPVFNLER